MRQALESRQIDLIVLDLNMPREDGLTLCRDLRGRSNLPVIMLTARGAPVDRIVGLEMGADDYVTKPFEPRELIARIRNVLRRTGTAPESPEPLASGRAQFGEWTFDLDKRHLVFSTGRVVSLSGASTACCGPSSPSQTGFLRASIWWHAAAASRMDHAASHRLQISRLRHKLGDDSGQFAAHQDRPQ